MSSRTPLISLALALAAAIPAVADAPLVSCQCTAHEWLGGRYEYVVDAVSYPVMSFEVGTMDIEQTHYSNVATPPGWYFTVSPTGNMAHACGYFAHHGQLSHGACWGITEAVAYWWTDDPALAVETFTFGYDHPWPAEDVGWCLGTRRPGSPPSWYWFSEFWDSPVGMGTGPLHGPYAGTYCWGNDDCGDDFASIDVVDVALRVDAPRDREADELHRRRVCRRRRTSRCRSRTPGCRRGGRGRRRAPAPGTAPAGCGAEGLGVDVDRVAARRLDDLDAACEQPLAEVGGAADAVLQVVLVQHLLEALGHRLEVATGQPAVGRVALGEDQQVRRPADQLLVAQQQHAADVDDAVLLGADRAPSARSNISRTMSRTGGRLARLALLDEPGVLGEAAGVEEEGQPRWSQTARTAGGSRG
jgi:hypothetical protein